MTLGLILYGLVCLLVGAIGGFILAESWEDEETK
jgi:uncharacterized protein YneF (UPF0154 family)